MIGSDSAPDLVIAPAAGVYQAAGAKLTIEGFDTRILELGCYLRALSGFGSIDYRLCLWRWDGAVGGANPLLGRTAMHTIGTAASAPENLVRVAWPLEDPVTVPGFGEILVGVAWETDPSHSMLLGGYSGAGVRYRKDLATGAGWPVSMKNAVRLTDHNMAAWVETFAPSSGMFVFRAGEWREIDGLLVRRDGEWFDGSPQVRRAGAWHNVF